MVIIVPSRIDYVLMDVYKPGILGGKAITSVSDLNKLVPSNPDVWMAYHHTLVFTPYIDELARLGYVRVKQTKYSPGALLLEQYHLVQP